MQALKKEKDKASKQSERLGGSGKRACRSQAPAQTPSLLQMESMRRQAIAGVRELRKQIEETKVAIDKADYELYELEKVARASLRPASVAGERAQGIGSADRGNKRSPCFSKEEVDDDDISQVVSRWTGIPVSKLMEGEVAKLLQLEEHLHRSCHRARGGGERVADAVVRARAGIQDPNGPSGVSFF